MVLPSYQNFDLLFDQEMDCSDHVDDRLYSCLFEESPAVSSNSYAPAMLVDEFLNLDDWSDEFIAPSSPFEGLEAISSEEIENFCEWIHGSDVIGNSESPVTVEAVEGSPCLSVESSHGSIACPMLLELPGYGKEVDSGVSLLHLLKVYGEATENGQSELAGVIEKSINKKSNPTGTTAERVAYNMFMSGDDQGEYIRQESSKNFVPAFKVLNQSLPNTRFAHFTATTAILEAVPDDAGTVWVVDFDVGEGIQWPPLINAVRGKRKQVKFVMVKPEEECAVSSWWSFEDTKKRLMAEGREYGVKMQVEEKGIDELYNEVVNRSTERDFVVFNCMVGLPHMGRRRPRRRVFEFLKVAEMVLTNRLGMLVRGEGGGGEGGDSYGLYFEEVLRYYEAIFESLEGSFPDHLVEARTVIESLFLSPLMRPVDWFRDWEERGEGCGVGGQLEGRRLTGENVAAARRVVGEGGGGGGGEYKVRVGVREHEVVLQWKETTLVKVSTWVPVFIVI
ncbi:protein NODULATION SIGNALING PATHWAY 2-like [Andrographis paniculata]|uniref:protein NODULATION SIGNALING PATHWAY 2-like n=1 Tax=Andrographis paniculata TaxID=175694 RepID=UPI0021E9ABBD|nr:protein NODULATION SIGNALING PATHWAY 2-like [Andrographis paniculata]